jgi:tetratricopeptide (TPR) repeat protein
MTEPGQSDSHRRSPVEIEVSRIRALTRAGRHLEAVAAAGALAVTASADRHVLYLLAANQRCLHQIPEALATLSRLEQFHPRFGRLHQERGHCFVAVRDALHAIEAFQRATSINPALLDSWTVLERLYRMLGDPDAAANAAANIHALKQLPPRIVQVGSLFSDGELSDAEAIARQYVLESDPHAEALRLLGRIHHQRSELYDAQLQLGSVIRLAPEYTAARLDYVQRTH